MDKTEKITLGLVGLGAVALAVWYFTQGHTATPANTVSTQSPAMLSYGVPVNATQGNQASQVPANIAVNVPANAPVYSGASAPSLALSIAGAPSVSPYSGVYPSGHGSNAGPSGNYGSNCCAPKCCGSSATAIPTAPSVTNAFSQSIQTTHNMSMPVVFETYTLPNGSQMQCNSQDAQCISNATRGGGTLSNPYGGGAMHYAGNATFGSTFGSTVNSYNNTVYPTL